MRGICYIGFYQKGAGTESNADDEKHKYNSITELLLELKIPALKSGIKCSEYWDMPLDDIADAIRAYSIRQEELSKQRLSEQACMTYANACFSAIAIYNPKKFPKNLHEAFPKLFENQPIQQEIKAYMQNFSKQRKLRKEAEKS